MLFSPYALWSFIHGQCKVFIDKFFVVTIWEIWLEGVEGCLIVGRSFVEVQNLVSYLASFRVFGLMLLVIRPVCYLFLDNWDYLQLCSWFLCTWLILLHGYLILSESYLLSFPEVFNLLLSSLATSSSILLICIIIFFILNKFSQYYVISSVSAMYSSWFKTSSTRMLFFFET